MCVLGGGGMWGGAADASRTFCKFFGDTKCQRHIIGESCVLERSNWIKYGVFTDPITDLGFPQIKENLLSCELHMFNCPDFVD